MNFVPTRIFSERVSMMRFAFNESATLDDLRRRILEHSSRRPGHPFQEIDRFELLRFVRTETIQQTFEQWTILSDEGEFQQALQESVEADPIAVLNLFLAEKEDETELILKCSLEELERRSEKMQKAEKESVVQSGTPSKTDPEHPSVIHNEGESTMGEDAVVKEEPTSLSSENPPEKEGESATIPAAETTANIDAQSVPDAQSSSTNNSTAEERTVAESAGVEPAASLSESEVEAARAERRQRILEEQREHEEHRRRVQTKLEEEINKESVGRSGSEERPKFRCELIEDVSHPPGTHVLFHRLVKKIWKIKNTGTEPWPRGANLLCVRCDVGLELRREVLPLSEVPPGQTFEAAVELTVKNIPGVCVSLWRPQDMFGNPIGETLSVNIIATQDCLPLGAAAQPTQAPPPAVAPPPAPQLSAEELARFREMGFDQPKEEIEDAFRAAEYRFEVAIGILATQNIDAPTSAPAHVSPKPAAPEIQNPRFESGLLELSSMGFQLPVGELRRILLENNCDIDRSVVQILRKSQPDTHAAAPISPVEDPVFKNALRLIEMGRTETAEELSGILRDVGNCIDQAFQILVDRDAAASQPSAQSAFV